MDILSKITLFTIVLLAIMAFLLLPCREYFKDGVDILSAKSTVIYSNKAIETDKQYLESLNPISNDLLIMNRCIEFKKGGVEKVITTLKNKKKFFISKKYVAKYTDFSTIEELIKKKILKLYDDSSKTQFSGPIYLLITQYPLYNKMEMDSLNMEGCVRTTQSAPIYGNYSPIIQSMGVGCDDIAHPEKLIHCEFYILMPVHAPYNGGVGKKIYNSWDAIKNNMSELLVGDPNINNVRSQDSQCFTKCGEIQTDGYVCGARNSVNDLPYKSEVFNSPMNNSEKKTLSDYANLYIINTNGINNLLGMTLADNRIIEEGIKIEPVNLPINVARETAFDKDLSHINDNANNNFNIDRAEYDRIEKELQEQRMRKEMSDIQAKCYLMRYPDLRNAYGIDIAKAKKHWVDHGLNENRSKECNEQLLSLINGATNGLTAQQAAPSAKHILDVYGTTTDGVYWINLPDVGVTQVYCIMNTNCGGGGWMLAMKGIRGNTFSYESTHWKTASTLNPANPSRSEGDAKYDVFNKYKARDWFAGFPDVPSYTGDVSRNAYNGFTWVENNAVNDEKTLLETFSKDNRITKSRNPGSLSKFNKNVWSHQSSFQFYGMNYRGGHGFKARWGFGWNENAPNDERSNDAGGGIGTQDQSAGDRFNCCGGRGLNRSMQFEFYVR
jgi:hypothetical protein